ncbi:TlpA family protein disulfide reductase [Brachybacterium muris]|uniref:Thioredoxin domain-containing protein n=1 Tax=Brachybacterium muris UCD-AY4 TaxID=1249481 RepID=A0A022KVQ2_9MICO|nr:MauE/DoxX family redox-associated membrane protein [Brachybacterium muris]EYT48747.1 hypothetical protein D641_0111125 [Brachybacterium muris UCD-AY4]
MSALLAAPVVLMIVFAVSGAAKLGDRQGTQDAMVSLRLPLRALHPAAAALLPLGELLLAVLIWVPITALQVVVAVAQLLLCLAYLVIIVRAVRFPEPVDCSCFGTLGAPTVSGATVARNVILVLLAVVTLVTAASGDLARAVLQSPGPLVAWAAMLALTVVLTALTIGVSRRSAAAAPGQAGDASQAGTAPVAGAAPVAGGAAADAAADEDELLDYERVPTPHVVVRRADGELVTVRSLAMDRAALLVWMSPGCGPCERVADRLAEWQQRLGSMVRVVPVLSRDLATLDAARAQRYGPEAVSDIQHTAAAAFGTMGTPSAALIGADDQLAGGPVIGAEDVIALAEDIIDQLVDARMLAPEQPAGSTAAGGATTEASGATGPAGTA